MALLTKLNSWKNLEKHAQFLRFISFSEFKKNSPSDKLLKISTAGILIDLTKQWVNETTIDLLIELAKERKLEEKIAALMQGEAVNLSEMRPALHTALRLMDENPIIVEGKNITTQVLNTREQMREIATKIREGKWLGASEKSVTDIVNIGIGGSDLGPRFLLNALADSSSKRLGYHFISDCDPSAFKRVVRRLAPETTLFIISSKSFTTQETVYNAKKALNWLKDLPNLTDHFIAVTANVEKARAFGIHHVLPIWDWVGGRYSLCSAINLITCIAIGYDNFAELLKGANSMDSHFRSADFHQNLPVMLGLIGLWNINFLRIPSLLLLVYSHYLEKFVPYIQQLDMESNGKSLDHQNRAVNYATGPIVWGGLGNQAQHSYYQLLCQGTHKVAIDFISLENHNKDMINTFCHSQMRVLSEGIVSPARPSGSIPGGLPLNHLNLESLSPFCLGALVALYEHKTYVQSVIWNINPFDQPGVESAKNFKTVLPISMT